MIPKGSVKDEPGTGTVRTLLGPSPDFAGALMMRYYFGLKRGGESAVRYV